MNTIERIHSIIKDNLTDVSELSENTIIMKIYLILLDNNIKPVIRQGWIINKNDDKAALKAKLYITFTVNAFRYFVLIQQNNTITITKNLKAFIYKKKPSSKKIDKCNKI